MIPASDLPAPEPPNPEFSVLHQRVELDIDPASRSLQGKTKLHITPHHQELKIIRLNCRQCQITRLTVNGKISVGTTHEDPYVKSELHYGATVHQYQQLRERIEPQLRHPPEEELVIRLGKNVKIEQASSSFETSPTVHVKSVTASSKEEGGDASAIDFAQSTRAEPENRWLFKQLEVEVEYKIPYLRDGLHFVGWDEWDLRHPHIYTTSSPVPGPASCLFPCVDNLQSRCTWDIFITCPRTIGDAFQRASSGLSSQDSNARQAAHNGANGAQHVLRDERPNTFSNEDKALELTVVCTGDLTAEIPNSQDSRKKTTNYTCLSSLMSPQHIGFAIGPFERVDLARFREGDEDERLGQNATPVNAYCLPGRSSEVENTCFPIVKAIDSFSTQYNSYPYSEYRLCFVDDAHPEILHKGYLSICSNHLLFPEDVLDPLEKVTRRLIHALASQWMGVFTIPKEPGDTWVVVGIAYYMTDIFLRKLSGNNEYRFNQKRASDRVVELDIDRPSLRDMGGLIHLDPSELEFMNLKAPLVLFILDQRLKKSGHLGMARVISKIFLNAKIGDIDDFRGRMITHGYFTKQCEKISHFKLQSFFEQWVEGTGCPKFRVQQRFNKKKLVVEMSIHQVQADNPQPRDLQSNTFMRSIKEEAQKVKPASMQPVFTGPMTIRIHEADGTPYEHIIEIKDSMTKFDVPYNTKYKRLKRTKRQKEKVLTAAGADLTADGSDDVLLYSLGDVLQSEDEVKEWRLQDWSAEDEDRMSLESYEWIRMDADFEWICKISLQMPPYMWVSQLQQDRDVVAQLETIQYLASQNGHPLISSICVRTLMDHRYFYGIRVAAAAVLTKCARDETDWIGLYHLEKAFKALFCYPDSPMPRRNDFSDRASYYMQCAIPQAIARIRDNSGRAIPQVRAFLLDKLKFNDNSNNEFSDGHYLSLLMRALAEAVATSPPPTVTEFDDRDLSEFESPRFHAACLDEIERYRRMDEWIPSYHNILSTTALDCKRILIQAGISPLEPRDFLQYTTNNTSDILALSAFSNLLTLGTIKHGPVVRWFLYVLGRDPSPYVRANIIAILGRTLGALATGKDPSASLTIRKSAPADLNGVSDPVAKQVGLSGAAEDSSSSNNNVNNVNNVNGDNNDSNTMTIDTHENDISGGLIIEQEDDTSTLARAALLARRQTVSGARNALKDELAAFEPFQHGLWQAVISPVLTLPQIGELLHVCELLYTPSKKAIVTLRYPRYWRVQRVAGGKVRMRFVRTDKYRMEPRKETWVRAAPPPLPPPPAPPPQPAKAVHPGMPPHSISQPIVLTFKGAAAAAKAAAVAAGGGSGSSTSTAPAPHRSKSMSMPRPPGPKREHSSPLSTASPLSASTSASASGIGGAQRQILKPPKRPTLPTVLDEELLGDVGFGGSSSSLPTATGTGAGKAGTKSGGGRKGSVSAASAAALGGGSGGGGGRKGSVSAASTSASASGGGGSGGGGGGRKHSMSVSKDNSESDPAPKIPKLKLKFGSGSSAAGGGGGG